MDQPGVLGYQPICACGTPYIISRKTLKYWEGEGSLGGTIEAYTAKGIGKGNQERHQKRFLHLGYG
eukprot:7107377-Karenia_brevis.AAC.1